LKGTKLAITKIPKELYLEFKKAREAGKKATFVREKLIIERQVLSILQISEMIVRVSYY
jgi:hypothetical protein